MHAPIKLTFLYNAALLVEWRGGKILLDALYTKGLKGLSPPLPRLYDALMAGEGPFGGVDTVLCTHLHPDHYAPAAMGAYLEARRPRRVILPREALSGGNPLTPTNPAVLLPLQEHKLITEVPLAGEDRILALRTFHMGPQYQDVIHYSFLLCLDGRSIFFSGDAGGVENDLSAMLARYHPVCMVVTPLFFTHPAGREVLGRLGPERVLVYHLPTEQDDTSRLRQMTHHHLRRYPEVLGEAVPLLTGGQSVTL